VSDSPDASPSSPAAQGFDRFTHFGGFDFASRQHHVVIADRSGEVKLSLCFDHDAQGWAALRQAIGSIPGLSSIEHLAIAVETSCGPAVERLLEMNIAIYPINPKSGERYRDRKSSAGAKSDEHDAWCFADALRTDGHAWRRLRPQDPLTAELRLLCRDEIALIEQRTALVNQLRAALAEYYPAATEAFDDWVIKSSWEFILAFPTPAALVKSGKRKHEKFLHVHKLWRPETASKRLEIFSRATAFASPSSAVTRAKSLLAVTIARQLCVLQTQLEEYRRRIGQLFKDHPDSGCFGSLPGGGEKLAPRLLAELGSDRSVFESHEALPCYAGTAPVTKQSGAKKFVQVRRSCNPTLRATVHLWANLTRAQCAWAEAYYQQKKQQGFTHAAALRCLGQRWLKILWTMWRENKPYDEARHTRNQIRRGAWVIALMPHPSTPS
jgi:transposase